MNPTRKSGAPTFVIEFTDQTEDEGDNGQCETYELPDIVDSFEIMHKGQSVVINKETINDIRVLGRGHYAENVMLCEVSNHPDLLMAVKRLALCPKRQNMNDFTTQTDLRTIRMIGSGDNHHVTRFYGAFKDREYEQLVICMEPCDASVDRFSKFLHRLDLAKQIDILLKRMICHISDALNFLKSLRILHRDVKPSNILINRNPVAFKLCDFGISAEMIDSAARTMTKGTQIYLAPERINRDLAPEGYRIQSDMWSLGLSALQIATNEHPFEGIEIVEMMGRLRVWEPSFPPCLSSELQLLIRWLLTFNHLERPATYDQIIANPAIQSLPTEVTEHENKIVETVINAVLLEPIE